MSLKAQQYDAPSATWLDVVSVTQEVVTTTPAADSLFDAALTAVYHPPMTLGIEVVTGDYETTLTVV